MIFFNKDLLANLKKAGYSSYKLAKENILTPDSIQRIRKNKNVDLNTIDIICSLLKCQPNDIITWKKNENEQ